MNVLKDFIESLEKKSNAKDVKAETELRNLGIDSLDLVEIVMDLEEKYKIQFSNDELNNFITVNDVVKAVESKL